MTEPPDLLIITASNGENLKLANRFIAIGQQCNLKSKLLDLTTINLPLYNPRTHKEIGIPPLVSELNETMISAPRWIICAPEYNGSIPPILTSAIAWLSVQDDNFRN